MRLLERITQVSSRIGSNTSAYGNSGIEPNVDSRLGIGGKWVLNYMALITTKVYREVVLKVRKQSLLFTKEVVYKMALKIIFEEKV